jgi:acyl carrier protein
MQERIIEIICKSLGDDEIRNLIRKSNNLSEFGINSLKFIQIIVELENEFCVEFNDNELNYSNYKSIDQIFELVQSKIVTNV